MLIDTVGQVADDTTSNPILNPIADPNSDYVLTVIETNMDALNYIQVKDPADADIAVNVDVVTTTNIVVTPTYPGYWYGCGIYWCDP